MASAAQILRIETPWRWLTELLKQEFRPYPDRTWTVARMTLAATLVMLWIMTFRIPGAALGAYYTLLFSRESTQATLQSVTIAIGAIACSLVVVLCGVVLFAGDPLTHFLWVSGTLFLSFFLISALTEYRAATAFGFLAVTSIAAWDFPANTEARVEGTLWTALAVAVAALVTICVELAFQTVHPDNQFLDVLDARLGCVESLLRCIAEGRMVDAATRDKLAQYAMTGTATLRRLLLRSDREPQRMAEMSTVVALTGMLIDLSAHATERHVAFRAEELPRLNRAAEQLRLLRHALVSGDLQEIRSFKIDDYDTATASLASDIERIISLFPEVFAGRQHLPELLPSPVDYRRRTPLFRDDALSNPDHLRFALKGTLAAVFCYFVYNAIGWHGLSTSIATCMITALSTIGSSRQKQVLRVVGAILGGIVFSMSAQVFLLPHMEGINEFTMLFVAVTLLASWIATSSPRVSYAGVQTAFAFYITHLHGFGPQTSLTLARDDVFGILFGLLAMWLLFDQIWVKDSVTQMMECFLSNMRRIAIFDKQIFGADLRGAVDRSRRERASITANFDQVRNQSDAVIFEFGSGWQRKIELRNRIRAWQPQLRTYFLLQLAVLQYRFQSPGRRLDKETEQNVTDSDELLALLADLKDEAKRSLWNETIINLQNALRRSEERLHGTPARTGVQGAHNPLALSREMLHLARDLARDMQRA